MPVKEWQTLAGNRPMSPLFSRRVRSKHMSQSLPTAASKCEGARTNVAPLPSNRHTVLRYHSWENPTRQQSFVPGCFIDQISGIYSFNPNLAAVACHHTIYWVLLHRGLREHPQKPEADCRRGHGFFGLTGWNQGPETLFRRALVSSGARQ